MDINKKDKLSASIFLYCEDIENLKEANEYISSIKNNKEIDIKNIYFVTDMFFKNKELESVSSYGIAAGDSLSNVWNKCAKDAEGEVFLFLRDSVLSGNVNTPLLLCKLLMGSEFDALSPAVYARKEEQYIYSGDDYSQAFFSGFLKMKYPFEVIRQEMDLADNPVPIIPAKTLSEECFAIRASAFHTAGGFLNPFQHYLSLGISCRMARSGKAIGWTPKLVLEVPHLYCKYEEQFGTEFLQLLESFGDLFSEKPQDVFRGVYCPREGFCNNKGRGRILLCSHELSRTGAPVVLLEMGRRLKKLDFQVFFASAHDGPLSEDILDEGFPLIIDELMMSGRGMREEDTIFEPWLLENTLEIFDKIQVNALVCHNLVLKFRDKGIPIIWWIHESASSLEYVGRCVPKDLGQLTRVYCVGEFSRSAMIGYGLFPNSEILLYGIENMFLGEFKKTDKKKEKLKLLLAGTFSLRKGQDILIEAILLLPHKYLLQTEFYIVGEPFEAEISDKIDAFCSGWPNAHVILALPREELFEMYHDIDVIISPSRDDPMPVVMTEGMMFYKVCICSTATGTAHYVRDGENGFVCAKDDPKDLARCIMEAVDMKDALDDMRLNSRKIYDEQFSIPVFDARLDEIFK